MVTNGPPLRLQNRYQLIEELGVGGMGIVFRAHDDMLNRDVAIKFLSQERMQTPEASERFMREARMVARLSHPNIMTLYDVGHESDWHYLILEYIPGKNLYKHLLENEEPFALNVALRTIRSILEALAYAHEQGIVHRDIKPQNIMITPTGQIKVTDFGLALSQGDLRLTQDGAFVGTVYYVAPEMAMGHAFDHRADLYAVGALFYELLTGTPPFAGDNPMAVLSKILTSPVLSPRMINADVPRPIETVIMRLLERNASDRYVSAEEVIAALPVVPDIHDSQSDAFGSSDDVIKVSLLEQVISASSSSQITADGVVESGDPAPDPQLLLFAAAEDLTSSLEAERRRLAGLLGSSVIEPLNLLLSQAAAYEHTLPPQAKMAVSVLTSLARQALQQVRDLEATLHPTVLEMLGLEPALETLVSTTIRNTGMQVSLQMVRLRERMPVQLELALFRAVQDALERAAKTAHASQVTISLEEREQRLLLSVKDNGLVGAHTGDLQAARQRIRQVGGSFETTVDAGGGLEVTIGVVTAPPAQLTPREIEVLQLIALGHSNKEIAKILSISARTVNFHLDNLYSKLGVRSRTEAAVYALRRGLVRRPPSDPG